MVLLASVLGGWGLALAATVQSIDVKNGGSQIVIQGDAPLTFSQQDVPADKQIILEVDGSLGPMASRPLDTSSFDSAVSLVTPSSSGGKAKVVIQMREDASAVARTEGNSVVVDVSRSASSPPPLDAAPPASAEAPPPGTDPAVVASGAPAPAAASGAKDTIQQFLENRSSKNFNGSPVSVMVRDADVREVLRLISETSGFNIVVGPGVEGKLTLSLVDVPWDHALDIVLQTLKLGAERNQNVLRVLTLNNLKQEKEEEIAARKASEESAPRVTKVFPISYADPRQLEASLKSFGSSGVGKPSGTVGVDVRTNSIIVQDIQDNIDRMTKLIQILDTQTPQVLVESKVVEARESFAKGLNGRLGVGAGGNFAAENLQMFSSSNGANPVDLLVGSSDGSVKGAFADGTSVAGRSNAGGVLGFSPFLGFLTGGVRINAILELSETESEISVVSAPKTVVLNKEKAKILSSSPVIVKIAGQSSTGSAISQDQLIQANLSLEVEPTVTNDETVLLQLTVTRDIPTTAPGGLNAVANRNLTTKVLVESGSTLVIGGIYTLDRQVLSQGFPLLRKLPLIGWLFGGESESTAKNELFIFVTPKILNTRKAGIGV